MITIKVGTTEVQMYNNVEELPIRRYSKFNKYNLIESGIGADMPAISNHFGKLFEFLVHKMHDDALREGKNLYYTFYAMLEEINIPGMAFSCLVHSIGGEEMADLTEDGLKRTADRLSACGLAQGAVLAEIDVLKKNSTRP